MTITIGKIYNKGCGHCVQMMPAWEKMKSLLQNEVKKGHIIIKDFETDKDANQLETFKTKLKREHNKELVYDGVPTIYKISGNHLHYYKGERTAEAMRNWALHKKGGSKKRTYIKMKKTKQMKKSNKTNKTNKNRTRNLWK